MPEAVLIGGGVAGLVDAAVYAAAEMLHEGAEDAWGNIGDGIVRLYRDSSGCRGHGAVPSNVVRIECLRCANNIVRNIVCNHNVFT